MLKNILHLGITLLLISGIAAGILGAIYAITKPEIENQAKKSKEEARKFVLPSAKTFEEKKIDDKLSYFEGKDESGKVVGYCFTAEGRGYSSNIISIVGVNCNGEIIGVKVITQSETPGLGALIAEDKHLDKFKKKKANAVKVEPDGGDIKPITGATITPRAVCSSISETWEKISKIIGNISLKKGDEKKCDCSDGTPCTEPCENHRKDHKRNTELTRESKPPRQGVRQ
ncbi:MAG: RnfABCDGE type electron transport complex subunit G [Candidatus Coatesbacteria bacterium]|nr:RnfABCDGE type electron transport complex subunit G [Candidatus Coatesbacteria bacterium]